jgi:autotransporter-associated beta strand protein
MSNAIRLVGRFSVLSLLAAAVALWAGSAAWGALTWDANGTGDGQTNGAGAWLGTGLWWDGAANVDWASGNDAIFGGPSTAGGAVTLASPTVVNSLTLNSFTGTYTLGTAGQTITLNTGITKNSGGAAATIISPVTLGGAQTWLNNSTGLLTVGTGAVTNGGYLLTIDGTGKTTISSAISGDGGLTKAGSGILLLTNDGNSYGGPTVVTGGVLQIGTAWNGGAQAIPGGISSNGNTGSNLEINGGNVRFAYYFKRALGAGPGQFQITGGTSGFSHIQADSYGRLSINNDVNYEVVWGSTYFKPDVFVLNEANAVPDQVVNFQNKLDLNGATRTVATNSTLPVSGNYINANNGWMTTTGGRITGNIRNSDTGNAAGLTKTGPGMLQLTGTNTYDGGTTINQGSLQFSNLVSMPAAGAVAVNTGTSLIVSVGGTGEWTTGTSGEGTIGGLLAGLGGQSGATVSYSGDVTLGLDVATGTQTFAGDIANVGTSLGITKLGAGTLALSGDNSYTGTTTVTKGTLQLSHADAIGGTSGNLLVTGGGVVVDPGVALNLTSLTFNTGSSLTVSGGTLAFAPGGSISNSDNRVDQTITSAITGSPAVNIKDNGAGNTYLGIKFAPTSGTVTLGAVLNPNNTGTVDKAGITLAGSTTGNSVASIDYAGGDQYADVKVQGGEWTVGNIRTGSVRLTGGTLIVNGTMTTMYQGLQAIPSGAKLGGALNYYMNDSRFGPFVVNSGGIVAPGNPAVDGGVGTINVQFNTGQATVGATTFNAGSIYEWQVGPANATDLVHVVRTTVGSNNNRTLTVGAMNLKILDAGGTPAATDQLPVFTYDTGVVRTLSLDSVVFDTSALGAGWNFGSLALTDDGAGIIYLTGLSYITGGNYWAPGTSGGQGSATDHWTSTVQKWATAPTVQGDKPQATSGALIFTDDAGTVLVDDTVTAGSGLTFEKTGYTLAAGDGTPIISLTGDLAANTITVGAVDANMTATIGVDLTADSGITKAGAGTLKLTAATIYNGDTALDAGTLELAPSSGPLTYDGKISGVGNLAKSGASLVRLTAANDYSGTTTVTDGTLQLNGVIESTPSAWDPVLTGGGGDIQGQGNVGVYSKMVFDYNAVSSGTPGPTIAGLLKNSYNGGLWNGADVGDQFRNSTAVATGLSLGWTDDPGTKQVTVMATYGGDANLDGEVDGADVDIWKLNVGSSSNPPATDVVTWALADFNYDGEVDGADVDIWKLMVGSSLAPPPGGMGLSASIVPEPSTLVLLAAALAALAGWMIRRRK